MIDINSKWFTAMTAQLAHAGWGLGIVEAFALYDHKAIGILALAGFAAVKEFVVDKYVEGQPFLDNLLDFSTYIAGGGLGYLLAYLK